MKFQALKVLSREPQSIISLDEAKAQLRILDSYFDDKVMECAESAVSYVETSLWQSLTTQTIEGSYSVDGRCFAELSRSPVASIETVQYYNSSGTLTSIEGYTSDLSLDMARVYFAEPIDVSSNMFAPIKITYNTEAPVVVSPQIKQAVLVATAQFFDERDAPDFTLVDKILSPVRTRYFL